MSGLVSRQHGRTAHVAAHKITESNAERGRDTICRAVAEYEPEGLTRCEMEEATGMNPSSIRPRVREAIMDHGLLEVAPWTRKSLNSDTQVEVLILTEKGREIYC